MKRTRQITFACLVASTILWLASLCLYVAYVPRSQSFRLAVFGGVVQTHIRFATTKWPAPPDALKSFPLTQPATLGFLSGDSNPKIRQFQQAPGVDAGLEFPNVRAISAWVPRYRAYPDYGVICLHIPLILPVALFALASAYFLLPFHRRRDRIKQGHCPHCGYNLTANTSNKCPECGTPNPRSEPVAQATARDTQPR